MESFTLDLRFKSLIMSGMGFFSCCRGRMWPGSRTAFTELRPGRVNAGGLCKDPVGVLVPEPGAEVL
jgi:hypothetical protein